MAPAVPYIIAGVVAAVSGYTAYATNKANAKLAKGEAAYVASKGRADEAAHMERLKKAMAEGKVSAAKQGVSLMSSSVQDVFDENMEEGMEDAVMIRMTADMESTSLLNKAKGFKKAGSLALIGGILGAGSQGAKAYNSTQGGKTKTPDVKTYSSPLASSGGGTNGGKSFLVGP